MQSAAEAPSPALPRSTGGGRKSRTFVGVILSLFGAEFARADGPAADKCGYTLFNPTPRELMREMSTDRPDTTESAYTVDAGHFQVELSFVDYTHDDDRGVESDSWSVMPSNLKVGLTNNMDLQLVFDPYLLDRTKTSAGTVQTDGFGDMQVRLKVNLWGNDGGDTALAVMPYIQVPTADDDLSTNHVQGGIIFPMAVSLPDGWGLGLQAQVDFLRDEADEGYGVSFLYTVNLNRDIVGPLAGYVEHVGIAPIDLGLGYQALVGGGLTYGLTDDVQLDVGVNFGISDEAPDFNVFAGISIRI